MNPRYKCTLSNVSLRIATRISKSTTKVYLNALKVVMKCVKLDPHLPVVHLRPLLSSCLPPNTELSTAYWSRSRRPCQLFLASGDDIDSTGNNIGNRLLSTTDLSQDEIDVSDAPILRVNFRSMYAKIMTNESEAWKALAYLKALKTKLASFDFYIRLD